MSTSLLQFSRWFLIVVLSSLLVYLAYVGVTGVASMVAKAEPTFISISGIVLASGLLAWVTLIPAIMLYSLVTKRLSGFASCVGMTISLGAFYAAIVLPNKLGVMAYWSTITFIPDPIKVLFGLILSIAFLVFPFWLLFRLTRLTNDWLYPRILKPLEAKI